ncbi:hypothetical protein LQZ21_11385 [Treponema sp. TIM-1]|uniref:hypothetical protein n=1 Tax=Treponema sp. TIM-1 TaxID=2898417 RepID=UPI0039801426
MKKKLVPWGVFQKTPAVLKRFLLLGTFFGILLAPLGAQDDFGFGFDEEGEGEAPAPVSSLVPGIRIGGEIGAELVGYVYNFIPENFPGALGNIFSGKLNFSASGSNADGVINLNLRPVFDGSRSPVELDEAYARAYFGSFSIEGGLRKLTWGKADSLGPLDVVNPLDYRDLTAMSDMQRLKIARPLVHLSYAFGDFSKLEAVFVPWFEGHRFDTTGRWAPVQVTEMYSDLPLAMEDWLYQSGASPAAIISLMGVLLAAGPFSVTPPDTSTLDYAQGGFRFTTTWASSDLGFQYYYGRLPQPAIHIKGLKDYPNSSEGIHPQLTYTPYHQIGVDYAQVIRGFNLRAELAAHITEDLSGDDGGVYNPFLAWSLGFDRDLLWGINLNLQVNETIRLLQHRLTDNIAVDTEAGKKPTSTRLTGILSKKFLRDELELRTALIWGLEDQDVYILPGLFWTRGDVVLEFSGGVFAGNRQGELGQYRDNGFIKLGLTYTF